VERKQTQMPNGMFHHHSRVQTIRSCIATGVLAVVVVVVVVLVVVVVVVCLATLLTTQSAGDIVIRIRA
jgi:t-SNARE complex subunit (syntaxin)